jgi:RES domain-containing protein
LVKTEYARTAFDGEGAFRFGGRWNSRGSRIVYASGSLSLAMLELLVHIDPAAPLPKLSAIPVDLPDAAVNAEKFSRLNSISGGLPWNLSQTRAWGDAWIAAGTSAALVVPSALVPNESNYLLNPAHPDFFKLQIGEPQVCTPDKRLR